MSLPLLNPAPDLRLERDPAADAPVDRWRDVLVLSEPRRLLIVRYNEIHWIRAEGRWTTFYCGANVHSVQRSLAALTRLLDPDQFVRIHRSLLVRLDRVRYLYPSFHGDYDVELLDGTRLPLSRSYVKQFLNRTALPPQAVAWSGGARVVPEDG